MRVVVLLSFVVTSVALAQPVEKTAPAKADEKKQDEKKPQKPRPRVGVDKGNSTVGDDAAGGRAAGSAPSRGGTPGTPSGSFTR